MVVGLSLAQEKIQRRRENDDRRCLEFRAVCSRMFQRLRIMAKAARRLYRFPTSVHAARSHSCILPKAAVISQAYGLGFLYVRAISSIPPCASCFGLLFRITSLVALFNTSCCLQGSLHDSYIQCIHFAASSILSVAREGTIYF